MLYQGVINCFSYLLILFFGNIDSTGDQELFPNPKGKSEVWKYFGFRKKAGDLQTDKTICRICRAEYKTQSSTTSLINHLNSQHKEVNIGRRSRSDSLLNQPTLVESLQKTSSYSQTSAKAKYLDELVLKYIVKDLKPVSTVDSKHFRNLVNGLDPKYDMPGHTYFGNKLAKIYDITSKSLKDILC